MTSPTLSTLHRSASRHRKSATLTTCWRHSGEEQRPLKRLCSYRLPFRAIQKHLRSQTMSRMCFQAAQKNGASCRLRQQTWFVHHNWQLARLYEGSEVPRQTPIRSPSISPYIRQRITGEETSNSQILPVSPVVPRP